MSYDGKRKRRGGKSRQRTKRRTTALLRDALPNTPLPRHRQPTINHEKLETYLAAVEKFVDDRNRDLADLRKSRANLEEIVRLLKTGTDPASIEHDIESAVVQIRAEGAKANGALDDMKELKTVAKEALGLSAGPQST
jgi:hypothetical protein